MDDLLQFVPEDQREQFSEVAKGYVKADIDTLSEFVQSDQRLYDKLLDKPLKTREQNLRENEFPKMLESRLKEEREKLMQELNPEETPAEKRLRELEQKLADKERKESEYERRNALREQYKDVAPDVAEKLYKLEDESVSSVIDYIGTLKAKIGELEKTQKYGSKPPTGGGKGDGKIISEADYNELSPKEQYAFITGGGQIGDN